MCNLVNNNNVKRNVRGGSAVEIGSRKSRVNDTRYDESHLESNQRYFLTRLNGIEAHGQTDHLQ